MPQKTSTPSPVLVGEARLIYEWCQSDKSVLIASGLDWGVVEALPTQSDSCEALSVQCKVENATLAQRRRELNRQRKDAISIRTALAKKIRYALYMAGIGQKIPPYFRRRVCAEIVGDLLFLVALCDQKKEILAKTGFNQDQCEKVTLLALQLQDDNIELKRLIDDYKDLRNNFLSAYHTLFTSSQVIRACAFEIFPAGSQRRKGYQSQYRKEKKLKR